MTPVRGQVVSLPGGDDQYISIEGVGISGNMPRTIACWAKADNTSIPDWTLIFGFTGHSRLGRTAAGEGGNGSHFNIGSLGGPGGRRRPLLGLGRDDLLRRTGIGMAPLCHDV